MQLFISIHRRASAIVAIALAAAAVSASATSARVLEGPVHQTGHAGLAVPPILKPAPPAELRAAEAQRALAHSYTVPTTARYSSAEFNAYPKAAPTAAISAPKPAPSESFHWNDAAIGAAIALASVLLVAAGTVAMRRRTQLGRA
jgi:hypothetical protein